MANPKLVFSLLLLLALTQFCEATKVSQVPKLVELVEELNSPEDTNATITCSVGSGELESLNFLWFKDEPGKRVTEVRDKIRIDIPTENYQSVLRIFNLKPDDSGVYTCLARNRFGQSKISTKLNVVVQLKWLAEPKDVVGTVNKPLSLPCSADGNPAPSVEWFKVNESARGETRQSLGSRLEFESVELKHAGLYECRASNKVEEDLVARARLEVLGK